MEDAKAFLRSKGWIVGPRDPRINTRYPGRYMVAEPYDQSELPTEDGRDGPWVLVGDDLDFLAAEAVAHYPCFDL